jgi:hypothetical protein
MHAGSAAGMAVGHALRQRRPALVVLVAAEVGVGLVRVPPPAPIVLLAPPRLGLCFNFWNNCELKANSTVIDVQINDDIYENVLNIVTTYACRDGRARHKDGRPWKATTKQHCCTSPY